MMYRQAKGSNGRPPFKNQKSQASPKDGVLASSDLPILTYGNGNNFLAFKEALITKGSLKFGAAAQMFQTNKEYEVEAVPVPASLLIEDDIDLTAEERITKKVEEMEYMQLSKARLHRQVAYDADKPKIFYYIYANLSNESKAKVKEAANWNDIETALDPFLLWSRIVETHAHGEDKLPILNVYQTKQKYNRLTQGVEETISSYKTRFDDTLKLFDALEIDRPDDQEQAMHFLSTLNNRYTTLRVSLENDVFMGKQEYPTTLTDMYQMATHFKTVSVVNKVNPSNGQHSSIFITTTPGNHIINKNSNNANNGGNKNNNNYNNNKKNTNTKNNNKKQERGKPPHPCLYCIPNIVYHWHDECPLKQAGGKMNLESYINGSHERVNVSVCSPINHKVMAINTPKVIDRYHILLDNQATTSIFNNKDFLTNIRRTHSPRYFHGICSSSTLTANYIGDFQDFGTVYYHPDASANILSFSDIRLIAIVDYIKTKDIFIATPRSGNTMYFPNVNGVYSCDMTPDDIILHTVSQNELKYTTKEVQRAKQAKDILRTLGMPSVTQVIDMINKGVIINCPINADDIRRAYDIYGPDVAYIKGKSTIKPVYRPTIDLSVVVNKPLQTLYIDYFFVNGIAFLVSVSKPMGLTMVIAMDSGKNARNTDNTNKALLCMLRDYKARNITIAMIISDRDPSFLNIRDICNTGLWAFTHDMVGAGSHVPEVERKIREVKEHARCVFHSLPFKLAYHLINYLIYFTVGRINMFPHANTDMPGISPREKFLGRKLDYKIDLRCGFGDYSQVINPTNDNTLKERATSAIALNPSGNLNGSVNFLCLTTFKVITRDQFIILPIDDSVIKRMNDYCDSTKGTDISDLSFKLHDIDLLSDTTNDQGISVIKTDVVNIKDAMMDHNDVMFPHRVDEPINVYYGINNSDYMNNMSNSMTDSHEDLTPVSNITEPSPNSGITTEDTKETHDSIETIEDININDIAPDISENIFDDNYVSPLFEPQVNNDDTLTPNEDIAEDTMTQATPEPPNIITPNYNLRSRTRGRTYLHPRTQQRISEDEYNDIYDRGVGAIVMNITVKEAMNTMPNEAVDVIKKELQQMLDKKVFHGVFKRDCVGKDIIRSFLFLKEKFRPNGEFDKLKARFVANGKDNKYIGVDSIFTSSPTVAIEHIFTLLCLCMDPNERYYGCVGDVPGAYLNAKMSDRELYMKIEGIAVKILCQLDSTFEQFVTDKGELYVRITAAIYGWVESSKLWYDFLVEVLKSLGLEPSIYDPCIFKGIHNGNKIILCIYVDDILILSTSKDSFQYYIDGLNKVFGNIDFTFGDKLSYLGMDIDMSVPGKLQISMDGFMDKLFKDITYESNITSPAGDNLFEINPNPVLLNEADKKYFHSTVAKLLYLSKRIRPDIACAVSFLTTRVLCSDADDMKKLDRLMKYVYNTRYMKLVLEPDYPICIETYIDASYGVHNDCKSQSSCIITLGKGTIMSKAVKQKIVTKSSTEAELVALSDLASYGIYLNDFVRDLGFNTIKPIIYQDNMSTITMIKNGKGTSGRSKHINIRYYWLNDLVLNGDIDIVYCKTEDMLADLLNKPKQGMSFMDQRKLILNYQD